MSNNPFAIAQTRSNNTALADATREKQVAEIQSQMVIAKRFPRDPIAAVDRILNACTRPTLAESALYSYSRGGSDVTGPSIRLAEAMAQNWGNVDCGVREVEQANGVSTMESYAIDLESNYRVSKVFTVPHLRYTRSGTKRLEDPRDIYELTANQGARRLRACILSVIPGDVTEAAVKQCETTLHASADISPEAIKRMIDAFAQFGVTSQQIETRIQRRMDAIQPAQVVSLKKIYASLRDGMSSAGDWFDTPTPTVPEGGSSPASRTDTLKAKFAKPAAAQAPAPEHSAEAEQTPDLAAVLRMIEDGFTQAEMTSAIEAAKLLPKADQVTARAAYQKRKDVLKRQAQAQPEATAEQTTAEWQAEYAAT